MKAMIFGVSLLLLTVLSIVSCSRERTDSEPPSPSSGQPVALHLDLEAEIDDSMLRALSFQQGTNSDGKRVLRPQFTHGQQVDVYIVVASTGGASWARTMKFTYDATSKKLKINAKQNQLFVGPYVSSSFYFVSGILGGTPASTGSTEVRFVADRELRGVDPNDVTTPFDLKVPYVIRWTPLELVDGSTPYSHPTGYARIKFEPMGALIGYRLGNQNERSTQPFALQSFSVWSNAFADVATFDFSAIRRDELPGYTIPGYTQGNPWVSTRQYTFSDGTKSLVYGVQPDRIYYAWVMPVPQTPSTIDTRVLMDGTAPDYQTYTGRYLMTYNSQAKNRPIAHGKVYTLRADVRRPLRLPIEYVGKYNLAGGNGVTYAHAVWRWPGGAQPVGARGPLRFSHRDASGVVTGDAHRGDRSGYYNFYMLADVSSLRIHSGLNPNSIYIPDLNILDTDGVTRPFGTRWRIPREDELTALIAEGSFSPWIKVGDGISGHEAWLGLFSHQVGMSAKVREREYTQYAIRFLAYAPTLSCSIIQLAGEAPRFYYSAVDNRLACAYRYRWLGTFNGTNDLEDRVEISVRYLGDDAPNWTLAKLIAQPDSWWPTELRRVLPTSLGRVSSSSGSFPSATNPGGHNNLGKAAYRASSNMHVMSGSYFVFWSRVGLLGVYDFLDSDGLSVRPFLKESALP